MRIGLILIAALLLLVAAAGCASLSRQERNDERYFSSPDHAVERTTELLRARDWPALSRYYDLSETNLTREELARGHFFYGERTTAEHPAGDMFRYRHPFPPGYRFHRIEPTARPDVHKLITMIEIDQGGGLVQRGLAAALLRHSGRGWQFLPEQVDP